MSVFRPNLEWRAAFGWLLATCLVLASDMPGKFYVALGCVACLIFRSVQAWRAFRFRVAIGTKWLSIMPIADFLRASRRQRAGSRDDAAMFMGMGFAWTQHHSQVAHEILRMSAPDLRCLPSWLPRAFAARVEKLFAPAGSVRDLTPQGQAWIHGVESAKIPVPLHYKALGGHTAVCGTTGAGKTRTFEVISTQVIHDPDHVLIVIDPKNDGEWVARVRRECARTGRKFLYWKQASPSESIRLNPLENWSQPSEIPTRVAQLMEPGPFRQFAFLFIDRAVKGELYVGDKPNLRSILRYAQGGVAHLLERSLLKFFNATGQSAWEDELGGYMRKAGQRGAVSRLDAMVTFYQDRFAKTQPHETLDGLISTYQHDAEHYARIIAAALPLLQMLATGETGLMLAPNPGDLQDDREIWDIGRVIRQKAVLYVGADSLSNSLVAQAVMSMLLADIAACAGAIYNDAAPSPGIVLMVDEAAEAMNEQMLQILNKGRGAGFKAFVAYQTRSDFTAKLGNAARMQQVLGNLNNQIVLRLEDTDTAQWFAEKAGNTAIRTMQVSRTASAGSESHVGEFNGAVSRSTALEKAPLVPAELVMQLPNLQYFLRVSGGAIYQGRIPILAD